MIKREEVADVYPLTPFQEGLVFRQWAEEVAARAGRTGAMAYSMQMRFRVRGPLCKRSFDRAWQAIVDRHDMLRTAFPRVFKDRPLQILLKACPVAVAWEPAGEHAAERRDELLADRALLARQSPVRLEVPPLMRLAGICFADDDHGVIWDFHHILMDGWCIGVIQQELVALYEAAVQGRPAMLGPVTAFSSYVAWVEDKRRHAISSKWAACLRGVNPRAASLPGQISEAPAAARRPSNCHRLLDHASLQSLQSFAASQRCTISDVLHALWGVFLGRTNSVRDVLFGSVRAIRPVELPHVQHMVGPCIGMVPVRVEWEPAWTLQRLLAAMSAQRALWQEQPVDPLPEVLQAASLPRDALSHFLVVENYPALDDESDRPQQLAPGVTMSGWRFWATNEYDFFVRITPAGRDGLRLEFEFDAARLDADVLENLVGCFAHLVAQAVSHPDQPLDSLALMERAQVAAVLVDWAHGPAPSGVAEDFHSLWRRVLKAHGSKTALRWGSESLTYLQLHGLAVDLAADLQRRSSGDLHPVALPAFPGPWLACGIVACALLGRPFLPLDPQWPHDHRRRVLSDSGAALRFGPVPDDWRDDDVCDVVPVAASLGTTADQTPTAEPCAHWPEVPNGATATAYIIYTSGTTGLPKGVAVGMRSLLNYTAWLHEEWGIGAESASALLTSAAYDLGYTAVFGTLFNGGCLTLLDETQRRDPDVVVQTIVGHRLTFLKATPSYLSMLQSSDAWQALGAEDHCLSRLFLGGEPQNFSELAELRRQHPQVQVHNHYGPTEATIGCISGKLDGQIGSARPKQLLGRPIPGAIVRIVDAGLQPVPPGVPGEVLLGGDILAQGYRGHAADLASERFVHMPIDPDQRFYRTGDHAVWTADGQVVFLGRRDDQVKVQGYRVQLADLAACVAGLPDVEDAAVLADGTGMAQTLLAFVVLPGQELDPDRCRRGLAHALPKALIPGRWIQVDSIPLTVNGKIDRAQLLALAAASARAPGLAPDAPATAFELRVLETFRGVLNKQDFGLGDDFFAWGGHSLKAIRLAAALRRALNKPVAITAVFDHPTPAGLARWLSRGQTTAPELIRLFAQSGCSEYDLIFFPTLLGSSAVFQELAALLPAHASCWGLNCPEPEFITSSALDFRGLAELMANAVAERVVGGRSHGDAARPLVLAGWSFGAYLAYETACALQRRSVAATTRLVLMDIPPPGTAGASSTQGRLSAEAVRREAVRAGLVLSQEEIESLMPAIVAHSALLQSHRVLTAVDADMLVIEACDASPRAAMNGWSAWTRRRLVPLTLPGDHYALVAPQSRASLVLLLDAWALRAGISQPTETITG